MLTSRYGHCEIPDFWQESSFTHVNLTILIWDSLATQVKIHAVEEHYSQSTLLKNCFHLTALLHVDGKNRMLRENVFKIPLMKASKFGKTWMITLEIGISFKQFD